MTIIEAATREQGIRTFLVFFFNESKESTKATSAGHTCIVYDALSLRLIRIHGEETALLSKQHTDRHCGVLPSALSSFYAVLF